MLRTIEGAQLTPTTSLLLFDVSKLYFEMDHKTLQMSSYKVFFILKVVTDINT